MGTRAREKPTRLAEKVTQIRKALGLSQDGMIRRMAVSEKITREDISKYERGLREPSLLVLLEYSRAARVPIEILVDDSLDLPRRIPERSEGVKRARQRRRS
jgi:transcriptional regulator with XRE-family HTH domain